MPPHFKEQGFYLTSIHILTFALNIKNFVAHLLLEEKKYLSLLGKTRFHMIKYKIHVLKKAFPHFLGGKKSVLCRDHVRCD